MKFWRAR